MIADRAIEGTFVLKVGEAKRKTQRKAGFGLGCGMWDVAIRTMVANIKVLQKFPLKFLYLRGIESFKIVHNLIYVFKNITKYNSYFSLFSKLCFSTSFLFSKKHYKTPRLCPNSNPNVSMSDLFPVGNRNG